MSRNGFDTVFVSGYPLRVLMVEDVPADAEQSLLALRQHGYSVCADIVASREAFSQRLGQAKYDVVLSELSLPEWTAADVLHQLENLQQAPPFILVTRGLDQEMAVRLIDLGADDYVFKDRLTRLPLAVRRVLRERRLLEERRVAAAERERLIRKLEETVSEVKRLNGLLPVCVTCKRILGEKGFWSRMEAYIERHSEARVSPSLCPECASRLYPEAIN